MRCEFLFRLSQAAGLAICRRSLRVEARVRKPANSFEILAGQTDTETGSCTSTSPFPSRYNSAIAPHSSSSRYCYYQKYKRAKPGNLETNNIVRNLRPRPRCKWDLRPFGVLRCVKLQNSTDFKAMFFRKLGTVGYKLLLCSCSAQHVTNPIYSGQQSPF